MIEIDKIYNEDCFEGMKRIEDDSIDCIICDPPYSISRDSNFAQSKPTNRDTDRFRISIDFGEWDAKGAFNIEGMCKEAYRILKTGGYFICFYDLWKIGELKTFCEEYGFKQLRFIEWVKTNPVPINSKINYLTNAREVAVCAVKGGKPIFNSCYDNGIYSFPICHDEGRFHPTQKPIDLISALIRKHSNEWDLILDCCMGSATTAIACIRENRHYIGFETKKWYYDKSLERIERELRKRI